jgi:hypothetical protein
MKKYQRTRAHVAEGRDSAVVDHFGTVRIRCLVKQLEKIAFSNILEERHTSMALLTAAVNFFDSAGGSSRISQFSLNGRIRRSEIWIGIQTLKDEQLPKEWSEMTNENNATWGKDLTFQVNVPSNQTMLYLTSFSLVASPTSNTTPGQ